MTNIAPPSPSLPSSPLTHVARVLFTGAGGAGTIHVLRALGAQGRYELIGCDATRFSAGFTLVLRAYVIPFGADPTFEPCFRGILEREQPDFVVPLVDEEIPIVHRLAAEGAGGPKMRVVAPCPAFCDVTLDKWTTFEALSKHGLGVAKSWRADAAENASYPAIVKPRQSRGSRGLAFLDSPSDLARYLAESPLPPDRYVVQERLSGREFTTSVVVSLDGELLAVVPKETPVKKGITQVGVTREVPAIDALCRKIAEALDPRGPFNVQLVLGDDGVPRVFEVNPRYSTTVALTLAAGIDEVDIVIRRALGEPVGPQTFTPNLMMVRHVGQVFVEEGQFSPIDASAALGSP